MNSAKVIMILAFSLTMKATIGQEPNNCACFIADTSYPCSTRGCSVGTNPLCDANFPGPNFDGTPLFGVIHFSGLSDDPPAPPTYFGCTCPGYAYRLRHNAYLAVAGTRNYTGYDYTTCSTYGGNARTATGNVPAGTYNAVDCCNYCCDRNDPYPGTTTASPTTPSTTTPSPTTPSTTTPSTTTPSTTTTSTTTESPTTASTTTTSTTTALTTTGPPTTASTTTTSTTTESPTTASTTTTSTTTASTTTESPTTVTTTTESPTTASTTIAPTTTEPATTERPTAETPTAEPSTTTTTAPSPPFSSGRKFVLDKWLYLSGLILLVLTTLKIN